MKRHLLFVFFLLFNVISIAQTTAIPDANFEQFLVDESIDTNGITGDILNVDAQAITDLNLSGTNAITDITGINAFINVMDLDLGNNLIADISLASLNNLINFRTNDNSALTTIDLTQNSLLETFYAHGDFPGDPPPITQIDLSQNINLISIDGDFLDNVTDFVFPNTNTIISVFLRYLADPTIDVSAFTNIEIFRIGGWRSNVDVILPSTDSLRNLRINSIDIPTIDLSPYTNLESLYLWGTYVENLTLPVSNAFDNIFIILHDIRNPLDFSIAPNLTDIDITSNEDTPLVVDVTQNLVLEDLDLSRNDMSSIDLTQNLLLEELQLNVNSFTTLDVTQNTNLDRFSAYSNQLPTIDLTQNTVLQYLNLNENLLPNLDVTQNIELRTLSINNNLFTTTGLDLTQNVELFSLDISYNQVESLNITQNVELRSFDLSHNLFPGNDILNQFSTIVANQGRLRGRLIANNNLLEGPIPDFYGLYDPTVQTRRFELFINENRFHFGDFEAQHLGLVSLLTTQSIGPSPDWVMEEYWYSPQARVNNIEDFTVNAGDDITLTTTVRGEQNHYVWFKDGVIIPDAPDAPEYTITNINSCDEAVYHSEIRSDLVPFENANPPGTDGKNLLLRRNDITLNVVSPPEACVNLTSPINGATDIPLNQTLTWTENSGACGYFISIGTTSGGTDILNNIDVGDVETYNIGSNFPPNTQIFVTITPHFASGNTLNCTEESFTTSTIESPTTCTNLTAQYVGSELPVSTNLEWLPVDFATGYFVNIGTTPGGIDVYNMEDVGNSTVFNPPSDFNSGTTYYVTIIPYNGLGNASGCVEEFFTTESTGLPCTILSMPSNGSSAQPVDTDLSWNAVVGATGYTISVGTTTGGTEIFSSDVGNVLTYDLANNLPQNTTIYVTITPYNAIETAINCIEASFETELLPPTCTTTTTPSNGTTDVSIDTLINWDTTALADGYTINIGITSGGTEIFTGDVGNVTSYDYSGQLPQNEEIFISVIPYNASGNATGCNEISFITELLIPDCTTMLLSPSMTMDVPITTNLQWDSVAYSDGYILTVGTTSGGNDIVDNEDVGATNNYTFASDLPQNETIYINIIPYNTTGNAINCIEYSFETEEILPGCSNIIVPVSGAINVPVDTSISWSTSTDAVGYTVAFGTSTGSDDILATTDVGNITTFNPPANLPANTTIFVTITSYNSFGSGTVCGDDQFTTEEVVPECTSLTLPIDGSIDVPLGIDLSWYASPNATGYTLAIRTEDILLDTVTLGNVTTYNIPFDLPQNTEIFVDIFPINEAGTNTDCQRESFTTELLLPECTVLTTPADGEINVPVDTVFSWDAIDNAEGYDLILSSGTMSITIDVGNVTTFSTPENLESETTFSATIIPYNSAGQAIGCNEIMFQTEVVIPECPDILVPFIGEEDVSVTTEISWEAIFNAEGYTISIGTTSGGIDIVNNEDVGLATSYDYSSEFPDDTRLYITIIAYNSAGSSIGCSSQQFTTENRTIVAPKFFTPNNDANHDYWQVDDPREEVKFIYIFDRYGKLLATVSPTSSGWDGTLNGKPLKTNDYWYRIELFNGQSQTGHFTLKR